MLAYIVRRLFTMLPLLLSMSFVTFSLVQLAPGDVMAQYKFDPRISQETVREMRQMLAEKLGVK